ncbi:MAG: Rv1733c family protein [Streptosporangiaceae bacterium]
MRGNRPPDRASALVRLTRGLWPDQNPLRRATDRTEAALVAGLVAAFLVGSPVAAITASHWVSAAGLRAEQTARYKVHATLLRNSGRFYSLYGPVVMPVPARWTAPDGSAHVGMVDTDSSARAGTAITIWTSESGSPIGPPPRSSQETARAALAAVAAFISVGLVLLGSGLVAIAAMKGHRLAAWEAAWRESGPRWTSKT